MQIRSTSVLFAVAALAACSMDSPTATELAPETFAVSSAKPGTCTFTTPNGKTHTSSASANACPKITPINVNHLAGTYDMTHFVVIQDGERFDGKDAEGEYLVITLHKNGTTSGHFFVPPTPGEEGSGIDLDLTGTWSVNGNQVTIQGIPVLEEMTWVVNGNTLVGNGVNVIPDDPFDVEMILTRR